MLIKKINKALNEGGFSLLARRSTKYFSQGPAWSQFRRLVEGVNLSEPSTAYSDVLFINGCTIDHPTRYRVTHQIEQLGYFNFSAHSIFRDDLEWKHIHLFSSFVFYRCPSSEFIAEFISQAKLHNKLVIFDIDDLIYDQKFVAGIEYLKTLTLKEHKQYMWHVNALETTLDSCDYCIAPTIELKSQFEKRGKTVLLNRNVSSGELVKLSQTALKQPKLGSIEGGKVRIGYLSGSITHNPDLRLIQSALINVAEKYENVELVLAGRLELSDELQKIEGQIVRVEFSDWKALPALLASLDINLAPLEDTIFNRAKSEIKWQEAALLEVPTIASNLGSFTDVIDDGVTGFLCANEVEWITTLDRLVADKELRSKVGKAAYQYAMLNTTTQRTCSGLGLFINQHKAPLTVIVIPTLQFSGGLRVIMEHAKVIKQNGGQVLLYVDEVKEPDYLEFEGESFSVIGSREIALLPHIDTMVATLWTTVERVLVQRKVKNKVYLVQNYEVDFYGYGDYKKLQASSTYCHLETLNYLTISKWCSQWMSDLYGIIPRYIANGIDSENFRVRDETPINLDGVIRILLEGNMDDPYKNVAESLEIVRALKDKYPGRIECHHLAYRKGSDKEGLVDRNHFQVPLREVNEVYRSCHVLIKSSYVESFSYPPLEMMATGGLVIVAKNGGNSEYTEHGVNCMLYEKGDIARAIENFDALISSSELRARLVKNGVKLAHSRDWKNIEADIKSYWSEMGSIL